MNTTTPQVTETARLRGYQRLMVALMFLGYAGYYFCRVNFSVATPMLIDHLHGQGVTKKFIGGIVTLGTLCYAIGKFLNGSIADRLGGRRMFLFGMGGAILCTLLFPFGVPFFTLAWAMNRLVQSTGWVGMVKMTSRWFSFAAYGAAMGVISLSFLLGDVVWRLVLGRLIQHGLSWQGVFYVSAGALAVIFVAEWLLVRESPRDIGEPEPGANPTNLFAQSDHDERPTTLIDLLRPLLTSGLFWTVCALSFGFTLVREAFGNWTPEYLHDALKMSTSQAASDSAVFPLFGGVSVLVCGFLGDRLGVRGRAGLILGGLALSVPALLALGSLHYGVPIKLPLTLLGVVAFVLIGPYAFLAGAISLDFGGKRGSATAAGWIDGIGYIGGMLAGSGVADIVQSRGWSTAFATLAGVTALSCIPALIYLVRQPRALSGPQEPLIAVGDDAVTSPTSV